MSLPAHNFAQLSFCYCCFYVTGLYSAGESCSGLGLVQTYTKISLMPQNGDTRTQTQTARQFQKFTSFILRREGRLKIERFCLNLTHMHRDMLSNDGFASEFQFSLQNHPVSFNCLLEIKLIMNHYTVNSNASFIQVADLCPAVYCLGVSNSLLQGPRLMLHGEGE